MSMLSDGAGSVDWQPTETASRHTDRDRAIFRIWRVTHIDKILSISIRFYFIIVRLHSVVKRKAFLTAAGNGPLIACPVRRQQRLPKHRRGNHFGPKRQKIRPIFDPDPVKICYTDSKPYWNL